jgi:hypothetical protein
MTALAVSNVSYLITRIIEQAPSDPMMVRELIQNAMEAAINAEKPKVYVLESDPEWFGFNDFGFNAKKLTFWNNGRGMSAKELRNAVNLSSSLHKVQRLDQNFGIGAKALSLGVNQEGMIWITCQDQKIFTAMLYKTINTLGEPEYARYDFVDTDGESPTGFKDIWEITGLKSIPWETNEDWTAVILCGNNPIQTTVKNPYTADHGETPAWLINQIYRRYFNIPKNLELRLFVGHSKGSEASVKFRSVYEYVQDAKKKHPEDVKEELVEDKFGSGIKIWYLYDGPYSGKSKDDNKGKPTTVIGNPATTPTFSGLVYKNEMYDVCSEIRWKKVAGMLGILYGARYLRVFVELPDTVKVIPDQYRVSIQKPDAEKSEIGMLDYAKEIRENMPQWFKDKIKGFAPANVNSDDIHKRAQELLSKLLVTQSSDRNNSNPNGVPKKNKSTPTGIGPIHKPPSKKTPSMAGSGKQFEIPMNVPDLQFIRMPDDLENASAANLKNRAAEYIEDNAIYINCMCEVIDDAVDNLSAEYQDRDETVFEKIKEEAKTIAANEMAWLVVKAVVYAMAKKRKAGYDQEDIEKALHPVSLTTHADNLIYNLDGCVKQLKDKAKQIEEGII